VLEERRLALEYYKNSIVHFFVPRGLISLAMLAEGGRTTTRKLHDRVLEFSRLFKHEFIYRADAPFDEIFDEETASMERLGELEAVGDELQAGPAGARLAVYADMLRTYLESYRVAVRGVDLLADGPVSKRDWTKRTLALGQRMYLSGEIELRESLSKHRMDTAIQALKERKLLRVTSGDMLEVPGEPAGEPARELEALLAPIALPGSTPPP
jgi:glycerol-3-phosphate O-acyltransferase